MKSQDILALEGLLVATLALVVACNGTLDLQIETTPGPEATLAALETENARLAIQVAELETQSNLGKLAYVQGGDIWVKELPDGAPQRLTEDGRNSEPRWSPSGRWLALRKDVEVWVIDAKGNNAHVVDNHAPVSVFAWSPVEDRLAYISGSGVQRLKAINADGTAPAALAPNNTADQSGQIAWGRIAWSPDGLWVAYVWERIGPSSPQRDYVGIWLVETQAGSEPIELHALPSPPQDGLILAGWTPDGQSLLFWRDLLFSASAAADGLPLLRLSLDGSEPVEVPDFTLLHPDFWSGSPIGQQMALTVGSGRETWSNKRVALLNLETNDLKYLTGETVSAFSPALSPDGQWIAYVAAPDVGSVGGGDRAEAGAAQRRIWVMNADGSGQRPLIGDPAYRDERPLWSADGTYVVFARMDEDGHASLWLVDAAGGTPEHVVDELTPAPEWFSYYGYIAWDQLIDWWSGSAGVPDGGAHDGPPPATFALIPLVATTTLTCWDGHRSRSPSPGRGTLGRCRTS